MNFLDVARAGPGLPPEPTGPRVPRHFSSTLEPSAHLHVPRRGGSAFRLPTRVDGARRQPGRQGPAPQRPRVVVVEVLEFTGRRKRQQRQQTSAATRSEDLEPDRRRGRPEAAGDGHAGRVSDVPAPVLAAVELRVAGDGRRDDDAHFFFRLLDHLGDDEAVWVGEEEAAAAVVDGGERGRGEGVGEGEQQQQHGERV